MTNESLYSDQFCIEISQHDYDENMIAIYYNGQIIEKTQRIAKNTYETCFNSFDIQNDIFRIAKGQKKVKKSR